MIIKALLVGLVYMVFALDFVTGTSHLSRPLILGTVTGAVLGDLKTGIIIGATLEMAFMGTVSIGAAALPDYITGTILGTAFAIQAGGGAEMAVALGIPISTALMSIGGIFGRLTEGLFYGLWLKSADEANPKKYRFIYYFGAFLKYLEFSLEIALAFYFGSDLVVKLVESIPEFVLTGLNVGASLITTVGFVMLLQQMATKKNIPFFFIGYFLSVLLGLPSFTIAIIAVFVAWIEAFRNQGTQATNGVGGNFDEF